MSDNHAANSVIESSDDEKEAGPSIINKELQSDVMNRPSVEFQCCACTDRFSCASMVTTPCGHRYCAECIKSLFMRSTRDEGLYPPKCCREQIPLALVAKHMHTDEFAAFELASVEYATRNRTYCSNYACATFIAPYNIELGTERATCPKCSTDTCVICNNRYHYGTDCPDDHALRQTRDLAREMGWQTCFACDRVVQLRSGCNHMTCPCSAEFCYACGVRWKECTCETADPNRIEERAEEIVDRDAGPNLLPAERIRRVYGLVAELQENHECEHSQKFQRIDDGAPRRGFRCEMCDARHHKYILQCRRCYVNVCEDCRRNRI
ncbi:ariadne RING finger [Clathrospora elynae]|uniref:RBR-type E3 ubiquitin transferase n=1 Tax=Clathrospora elynae TaxID=706981 RepID=A0A6A5SM07_9PLEO|nr:ariadne RING finger [Clathrospora elynae]